jgi:multidrug resistance efflux pump
MPYNINTANVCGRKMAGTPARVLDATEARMRLASAHERLAIAEREADLAQRRVIDAEQAVKFAEAAVALAQKRRDGDG